MFLQLPPTRANLALSFSSSALYKSQRIVYYIIYSKKIITFLQRREIRSLNEFISRDVIFTSSAFTWSNISIGFSLSLPLHFPNFAQLREEESRSGSVGERRHALAEWHLIGRNVSLNSVREFGNGRVPRRAESPGVVHATEYRI